MAAQPYVGPTALGYSKYASLHMRKAELAFPPAVSSTHTTPTKSTIATREQIAADESAFEIANRNSDAELAITSGNALKEEVSKHAANFSRAISVAVTNTRQLLELIRDALNKEDESAFRTVDELWVELEHLFEAAKGAKDALPEFLEKQRNNMALYHGSVMNETYRESQEELNMQHKKVNLQHGLILEHQQTFQNYKASMAAKLKELDEVRERASRLTLEKGNFKDEIDKYAHLLETEQATRAEDLKKAEAIQEELKALSISKERLLSEVEGLQKTIDELQEKIQATEQQITDRYTAELNAKTELLVKETAKTTDLNTLVTTLKGHENNAKMENEKLRAESKMVNEKYSLMAAEHSQIFSKSKDQMQKIDTLTADLERIRKEGAGLATRLEKLPELEGKCTALSTEKANLQEQVGKLAAELTQAKEGLTKANKELVTLTEALQEIRSQNQGLEIENDDLLSKQKKLFDDSAKATQAMNIFKTENAKLNDMVDKLNAIGGFRLSSTTSQGGNPAMEQKIKELETKNEGLGKALDEWTKLAKRSYNEYKEMLPIYKQADDFRKSALNKDEQIKNLKLHLANNPTKPNGVAAGGDGAYWKAKYEDLMARVTN